MNGSGCARPTGSDSSRCRSDSGGAERAVCGGRCAPAAASSGGGEVAAKGGGGGGGGRVPALVVGRDSSAAVRKVLCG